MPRNVRNVWIDASIDGRASRLEGGPANKLGGLSATILQRSDGSIGETRFRVQSFANGAGRIRTDVEVDTEQRDKFPGLFLETFRDRPGSTVTLDIPGLVEASTSLLQRIDTEATPMYTASAHLFFRTAEERDAFLSVLAVHRNARAEVSA